MIVVVVAALRSVQTDERQNRHHDHDETDEINDRIHDSAFLLL
jgi:hypothetical protein